MRIVVARIFLGLVVASGAAGALAHHTAADRGATTTDAVVVPSDPPATPDAGLEWG